MDWHEAMTKIKPIKEQYLDLARKRLDNLTKPQGSLGLLEDLAARLVSIYQEVNFSIDPVTTFVFACDHGITEENVSAYPSEVTTQMVHNFIQGGAAINVLTRNNNVSLKIVDVGMKDTVHHSKIIQKKVRKGTRNFLQTKALTPEELDQAIQIGFELGIEEIENGTKLLTIGEMGIGNTTATSAITASLLHLSVEDTVGRGTGLNNSQLQHKKEVIKQAISKYYLETEEPLEALRTFGGLEIASMVGMILAASFKQIPVLLDGVITGVAALIASKLNPNTKNYLIASHQSAEPAHFFILKSLQVEPLLQLSLRLGEGTGAILALPLLRSSKDLLQQMATFTEANVSDKTQ